MNEQNYLSIYAKSFNWAGFFLPKQVYSDCSNLYDFCRYIDNIADEKGDLDTKLKNFNTFKQNFKLKNENNKIYVEWRIRENYYLYFDSIKIQNKKEPIRYKILESSIYETEDEYFGKTKIYKDYLKIVFNDNYDESDHAIFYQGCAEQGFCYPIQKYIL